MANDTELRAFIKQEIKNEVVNILRGEVRVMITDAIAKATKESTMEALVVKLIKEHVDHWIRFNHIDMKKIGADYVLEGIKKQLEGLVSPEQLAETIVKGLAEQEVKFSVNMRLPHKFTQP